MLPYGYSPPPSLFVYLQNSQKVCTMIGCNVDFGYFLNIEQNSGM